jgi:hypothetical protein
VIPKVRERLSLSKQMHRFHMEWLNLKKLNEVEGRQEYCIEISNRFAALEKTDAEVDINGTCETVRENIKISAEKSLSYNEFENHKPTFDEGCSKLLAQGNKQNFSG